MKIEVLYFEGCPHHRGTVGLVEETIERLGMDADVTEVRVESDEHAEQIDFLGSPTVRIDGVDIEPNAASDATVGLSCRVYSTPEGPSGIPPEDMLESAMRRAAAG